MALSKRFVIGIPGKRIDANIKKILLDVNPIGIILFKRNINQEKPDQLKQLCNEIRELFGKKDFLIMVDEECKRVSRLGALLGCGLLNGSDIRGIKDEMTADLLLSMQSEIIAINLMRFGFNCLCGPVIDVFHKDINAFAMNERSWSDNVGDVSRRAKLIIENNSKYGIMSIIKHLPGTGRVLGDPHVLHSSINDIGKKNLLPIKDVIEDDIMAFKGIVDFVDAGMFAFARYGVDDNLPAARSHKIVSYVKNIMTERFISFTDAIEMFGAYDIKSSEFQALPELARVDYIKKMANECLSAGIDFVIYANPILINSINGVNVNHELDIGSFEKYLNLFSDGFPVCSDSLLNRLSCVM
uniref:beta-N-acetylhexosaminidase n=1 Tax=Biomphalaria glabrata TaxID=6526 RepID=A0A2C9LKS0_BIOGL